MYFLINATLDSLGLVAQVKTLGNTESRGSFTLGADLATLAWALATFLGVSSLKDPLKPFPLTCLMSPLSTALITPFFRTIFGRSGFSFITKLRMVAAETKPFESPHVEIAAIMESWTLGFAS